MNSDRWSEVDTLYHAALQREPAERMAFLEDNCPDKEVRLEVRSLLKHAQEGDRLLEDAPWRPNLRQSAMSTELGPSLAAGTRLGRYEIVSPIGAGGMGEVYRARDTRLKRDVALKVLPSRWVADPDRQRRFEQEARAASALNHPNIVTIFDIDHVDGVNFIAMEYVPGRMLSQVIPRRGLPVPEALSYAIEIAAALASAHAAGIVHRDIKPSNLMLNETGQVKVLDFGLAKLVEPVAAGDDEPTGLLNSRTAEGAIVGTVSYMSPEQAQGKPVDARSDIFSFGSVLYEMVTGRRAFTGETQLSTLVAIVNEEPLPLSGVVPRDLEKLIARCLRKDPARRSQHMDDVLIALQELQEESGLPAGKPPATRSHWRRWVWAAAALVALMIAGAVWWLSGVREQRASWDVVQFTNYPGDQTYPSFSPDGNQVVFVWSTKNPDSSHLYKKRIGSPTPVPLTTKPELDLSPAFSPDGASIGFIRCSERHRLCSFATIPEIGGSERIVADLPAPSTSGVDSYEFYTSTLGPPLRRKKRSLFAWLPDGKHVVMDGLTLLSVQSGEQRPLTSPAPNVWPDHSPSVSPDGRTVAFARVTVNGNSLHLLDLDADLRPKGEPRRLTSLYFWIHSLNWTPDGRKIIFVSALGPMSRLWVVAASGSAEPEQLPIHDPGMVSLSRAGNRLVYGYYSVEDHIWRFRLSDSREALGPPARSILSTRWEYYPQYSPDGKRIAFQSLSEGDRGGIWVCNADGSNLMEVYSQPRAYSGTPRWAPDGERLAFDSFVEAEGKWRVFVIRAGGAKPVQLTAGPAEAAIPSWSADGKWVYFSTLGGQAQIWKAPAGGGEAVQVTRHGGLVAFESRDGKFLYYTKHDDEPAGGVWKMPVRGGEEELVIPSVAGRNFAVANAGLYFIEGAGKQPSIRFLAFATGKIRTISPIPSSGGGFAVSPDERSLLLVRPNESESGLMLVEHFRP